MQLDIDNNGGVENNVEKFELYLEKRQIILKHFGLPDNNYFDEILHVKKPVDDTELNNIIEQLINEAEKFLLSEIKSDRAIIQEARHRQLSKDEVFIQLGITPHIYTFYVFDEILLLWKDSHENIAKAFELTKEKGILNNLGIVALCVEYGDEEKNILENLKKRNIPYLEEYINYYESERNS